MTRLFARVYLDEDVSVLVADLVRVRGFQILTARDAERLGQSDIEQLRYATELEMAILTHNRVDFEALHRDYLDNGRGHWGIFIASRRYPHHITANLVRVLNRLTADELRGQLLYI